MSLLSSSHFAFSLLAPTSTLLFQTLSHDIFFLLKQKKRKTIEDKRNAKKGGSFPSNSHFALTFGSRFCPPISTLLFQTLSPSIFFFSSRRKKEKKMQRKEGTFFQVPTLPFHF